MPLVASNEYFAFYGAAGGEPEYIGATMLFQQSNAPIGWTKDTTTVNDFTLRVTSGTGGGTGGSTDFSSIYTTRGISGSTPNITVPLGQTPINATHLPAHSHTYTDAIFTSTFFPPTLTPGGTPGTFGRHGAPTLGALDNIAPAPSAGNHSHPAGPYIGVVTGNNINMNVQYVDFIVATKE